MKILKTLGEILKMGFGENEYSKPIEDDLEARKLKREKAEDRKANDEARKFARYDTLLHEWQLQNPGSTLTKAEIERLKEEAGIITK